MQFVILECRNTLDFARWGKLFEVWVPRQKDVTIKNGERIEKTVAAMPGYAFVPVPQHREVLRKCASHFMARVMEYRPDGETPRTVHVDELQKMQLMLQEPPKKSKTATYVEGDRAIVTAGPFAGFEGIVQKGCTMKTVRLSLGKRFVNLPRAIVVPAG